MADTRDDEIAPTATTAASSANTRESCPRQPSSHRCAAHQHAQLAVAEQYPYHLGACVRPFIYGSYNLPFILISKRPSRRVLASGDFNFSKVQGDCARLDLMRSDWKGTEANILAIERLLQ